MDPHSSSLSCELRIIKAKNIDHIMKPSSSGGVLFVRCYLSTGNSTRAVRLETQEIEIPSKSDDDDDHSIITWNQTFSLDCSGAQESINRLKQGSTIVFELRHRRRSTSPPLIGRILQGSKLVGRGEVPWKNVVESAGMGIEQWVVMIPGRECVKLPAVQIAMKIEECGNKRRERKGVGEGRWGVHDEGCGSCVDYEFFAIEAALEAL
ncbi:hypothetical protein Salat_2544900 [Sesamum alatum]|uniref:C2 domain-containing protein n=1 Tax=Sesamum alatum TaxID=300844 RepID=A0AAE1XTD0_9LAMI|nr:hypothetical protein Salat_2544900 [Sesamum alatum]